MNVGDFGISIGKLEKGALNSICDVDGVKVGHATIDTPEHKTGVTVVIPAEGNLFRDKLIGASFVLNGFGKTLGLVQVDELGTLETPIALTNTLNVGLVHDALVEYTLSHCASNGVRVTSINPVVCECNDSSLNMIEERAVTKEHVFKAIESAGSVFELGDVGCGKGTTCHGLKGGVGTASRVFDIGGRRFTVGVLMQTNHGRLGDLRIDGKDVGTALSRVLDENLPDKGSCITVVGTDLPLSSRQLRRVLKRAS
ncbi:MAG: P1 family peptidase, partial [Clostridia bacterium]|nr:P1 family peptidase [Clostridia bacterium]